VKKIRIESGVKHNKINQSINNVAGTTEQYLTMTIRFNQHSA